MLNFSVIWAKIELFHSLIARPALCDRFVPTFGFYYWPPVLSCPVDWCLHPSLRTLQMLLLRVKVLWIEHVSTSGRCQCSHRSFIQGAWMTFQYQIHVLSAKQKQNLVPSLASRCLNDFVGENSDFKHNGYNQYCLKAIQKSPASIVYFNIRRTVWCVNSVSSLY